MSLRNLATVAVASVVLLTASPARAMRVELGEDVWTDFRVLAQIWAQSHESAEDARDNDFFVRRARLIAFGSVNPHVSYFLETDSTNFGRDGNYATRVFVQDVLVSFHLSSQLTLDAGLLLVPLTRHNYQGAIALLGIDFYATAIQFPTGATLNWRDVGVRARGSLGGDLIQYRVGAFGGVRRGVDRVEGGAPLPDLNPDSVPLVAANLRLNLIGSEPELFPQGLYLGKRTLLSIGIGGAYQPRAAAFADRVDDYLALSVDAFGDFPFADHHEIALQGSVLRYRGVEDSPLSGVGGFFEAGYRYRDFGPVVAIEWFDSEAESADTRILHLGLAYWLQEHVVNLKADFAIGWDARAQGVANLSDAEPRTALTLQSHLFF